MPEDAPLGSAANPSVFDPIDRMDPSEPRFALRGKDPDSPATITFYAHQRRNRAIKTFNSIERPSEQDRLALNSELAHCAEADERAHAMQEWRTEQAPAEEGARASYNDLARTQEQLAELARAKRRDAAHRHIQEGRFHLCEARDIMLDLALIDEEHAAEMTAWLDRAQVFDENFASPRREEFKDQPALPLQQERPDA